MERAGAELRGYKEEYDAALDILEYTCEEVCDEMWPEAWISIGIVQVWCQKVGETTAYRLLKLKIGTLWKRPLFNLTLEMARRIVGYGVTEQPDWFPLYGMF